MVDARQVMGTWTGEAVEGDTAERGGGRRGREPAGAGGAGGTWDWPGRSPMLSHVVVLTVLGGEGAGSRAGTGRLCALGTQEAMETQREGDRDPERTGETAVR